MPKCCYFLQGDCSKGHACKFEHTRGLAGGCSYGAKCAIAEHRAAAPGGGSQAAKGGGKGQNGGKGQGKGQQKGAPHGSQSTKTTMTIEVEQQRKTLDFAVAVDVSGSMQGAPLQTALAGLEELVRDREVMHDDDWFALSSFASSVQVHHRFVQRRKVDVARDLEAVRTAPSGRTALWDAIAQGISDLKELRSHRLSKGLQSAVDNAVAEHLVITDGMDSGRGMTVDQIRALVEKPGLGNYHLVLIAVGVSERHLETMRAVCEPAHARVVAIESMAQLRAALQKFKQKVVTTLHMSHGGKTFIKTHEVSGKAKGKGGQQQLLQLGAVVAKQLEQGGGLGALANGGARGALTGGGARSRAQSRGRR